MKRTETTEVTEESIQDVLNMLKGLNPHDQNCPGRKDLITTWFPTFSEEGIEPSLPVRLPNGENKYESSSQRRNVFYQCGYSGHSNCRKCMRENGYEKSSNDRL